MYLITNAMSKKRTVRNGLLFLLIVLCSEAYSQQKYYYYKGAKHTLMLDKSRLNVTAMPGFRETAGKELEPKNQVSSGKRTTPEVCTGNVRFESRPDEPAYRKKIRALKRNPEIITVQPCFLTSDQDSVEMSSYFYVKLKKEADSTALHQFAKKKKALIVRQNRFMPLWYVLQCTKETPEDALSTANIFYESGLFAAAEPDFISARLHGCNDPDFSKQWGLNNTDYPGMDVNACAAWELSQGEGVKVAVFDSGVQLDHPDLLANLSPLSYDAEDGSSPSYIYRQSSHGTHCAGIIGAVKDNNYQVAGIAPKCTLMSISYPFSGNPFLEPDKIADGINWAWMNGADVINNSWGCKTPSQLIDEAIENALTRGRNGKGTVVVFAAGNDSTFKPSYPANSHSDILVVGSIDKDGFKSSFSNWGNSLDLVAPGRGIFSTILYSLPNYKKGTSMAASFVSGISALVLSRNPDLTAKEVGNILEQTAKRIRTNDYPYEKTSVHPNGFWNIYLGYGLVDAYAAVQNACTTAYFFQKTITTNTIIKDCEIYSRDIKIKPGNKLILDSREGTSILFNFEVQSGAELELK